MPAGRQSLKELRQRFDAAYRLRQLAREIRDSQRLNDLYIDVRPTTTAKSYAGTVCM
jgi:hypothetical protein